MSVILGIDGGGTNTRAAVVVDGKIVGHGQSGSIKRLRVGAEAAEANMRTVLKEACVQAGASNNPPTAGMHGFDAHIVPEMKACFFAAGPDLRPGKTVAPFDNVNLYPWMAHILGLTPPKNDGSLNILSGTLRDDGVAPEK